MEEFTKWMVDRHIKTGSSLIEMTPKEAIGYLMEYIDALSKEFNKMSLPKSVTVTTEGMCEACNEAPAQWLIESLGRDGETYLVCSTCHIALANRNLRKPQFKNLLQNGHKNSEHLLHGDFYDDDGNALQPCGG